MLLDSTDLDILRLTGTVRNLPCDMSAFNPDTFSQEKLSALCKIGLLIKNRNKLSYSLSNTGIILLTTLGFDYASTISNTPSSQKLKRRLDAAYAATLFHSCGFNVFSDTVFSLDTPYTYLSSASLRKDNSQTRVFGGARFTGIARNEDNGFLVQYIDDGRMYFTNEMRLFNNAILTSNCKPNVIYTGKNAEEIFNLLTAFPSFIKPKRNQNDAVTYRVAYERTQYPLYVIEASERGALQLRLICAQNYREKIAGHAFSKNAEKTASPTIDAAVNGELFVISIDLDLTRLKAAIAFAKSQSKPSISIIALPWQLPLLEHWLHDIFPASLYSIEQKELETLFPELSYTVKPPTPIETEGGYVQIV